MMDGHAFFGGIPMVPSCCENFEIFIIDAWHFVGIVVNLSPAHKLCALYCFALCCKSVSGKLWVKLNLSDRLHFTFIIKSTVRLSAGKFFSPWLLNFTKYFTELDIELHSAHRASVRELVKELTVNCINTLAHPIPYSAFHACMEFCGFFENWFANPSWHFS